MVTLNTIAYNILKNYRIQTKVSDDLDIRYIYQWVNNARAKYVKQRLDKSTFEIDQSLVQSLGAVELELVDSSIAMSLSTPLPADKYFLRTKLPIPKTIDRSGHPGTFVRIGPADRYELKYKVLTHEDALSFGFGKFNKKDVCAFVIDDKVYLCSRDMTIKNLKWIDIRGVFQDAMAAGLFTNVTYDENSAYPIGEDMVHDIEKLIYTEKLAPLSGEKEDTNNNGANDIINVGLGGKR